MGISIDIDALSRFSNKLEVIDRAELAKKQNEIQEIQQAQMLSRASKAEPLPQQSHSPQPQIEKRQAPAPQPAASPSRVSKPNQDHPVHRMRRGSNHRELTYQEVKQREAEITFELGELKIRESELLEELITLSQMLDDNQFN